MKESLEIGTDKLMGGLLCYSGSFIKNNRPLTKNHKIMLIHGESDEVIPVQSMINAKSSLENLGAEVESHVRTATMKAQLELRKL